MKLIEIFTLFLVGCFLGWIIEVIYRSGKKEERTNPGFLSGPYLPIYGFSISILYAISSFNILIIPKITLLIFIPTIIELLTGLLFRKYFKTKLWDYSEDKLNYKGIVCLKFSIYWGLLSVFYYFFLHKIFASYLIKVLSDPNYIFIHGAVAGIFLLDVFYSFNIAFKLRKIAKWENFTKARKLLNPLALLKEKIKQKK